MAKASATSVTSDPSDSDDMGACIVLDFHGDNLDPESLASVIPLRAGRPTRKGQRLGPGTRIAPTGYCGFSTLDQMSAGTGNAHLAFLLEMIESRLAAIRDIMTAQSLTWKAVFFEGEAEGTSFADLSSELLQRAARIGLPVLPKGEEKVTFWWDPDYRTP